MEQAPDTIEGAVMAEAPRIVRTYDDALELLPEGKGGVLALELLVEAVKDKLPATCLLLDAELSRRDPSDPGPAARAALDAVEDSRGGGRGPLV